MISKDQSIITQVAAKIAADLTPKSDDVLINIANWAIAFDATAEALLEKHGMTILGDEELKVAVATAFPNSTPVATVQYKAPAWATEGASASAPPSGFTVRIKGTQHGPIPEWLNGECAKKGVTEVWDNRDGLNINPKRPWFKSTSGNDAFWAPRK